MITAILSWLSSGVTYMVTTTTILFIRKCCFICLNSEMEFPQGWKGTNNDIQYNYVKTVLEDNVHVRWTFVFTHHPMWLQKDTGKWMDIEKLLSDRKWPSFYPS